MAQLFIVNKLSKGFHSQIIYKVVLSYKECIHFSKVFSKCIFRQTESPEAASPIVHY